MHQSIQPSNSSHAYPEQKVQRVFILAGTLFQLILFPFAATLFTADSSLGVLAVLFFPVYIAGGGLFGMVIMSIIGTWHVHKKRTLKEGWWRQTFFAGYLITTVFYVIFLNSMIGVSHLLAIGLIGGISAVLAGMSALPAAEEGKAFN